MSLSAEQIYELLPAVYRTLDAQNGYPLQALVTVIAAQSAILEDNIQQLYDDLFIETCAPWVIPYIGDLVGSDTIYEIDGIATGRRAEVANTIGYRRRKGTLIALEQVAMDVSGMPACGVEFFKRLITTESMRHVRPDHASTVDLRNGGELERWGTAFDRLSRTVEVRRIAPRVRAVADPDPTPLAINLHGGGRFNIPDVGVYLWRWTPFQIVELTAVNVGPGQYMFSPLGQDIPLFNPRPPRNSFSSLTTRLDVPQPITRREFWNDTGDFYGPGKSLTLFADGSPIPLSAICSGNLQDRPDGSWGGTPSQTVAIDPELGRILVASDYAAPNQLQVSYYYGFPANIGGGPYDRSQSLPEFDFAQMLVLQVGSLAAPTLESAVSQWNSLPAGSQCLIVLPGFESFETDLTGSNAISLPSQSQLWIVSARVNAALSQDFTFEGSLAVLRGNIQVQARAALATGANDDVVPGQLSISGVWISGTVNVFGAAGTVQLLDCTLVPGIALERSGRPIQPDQPSVVVSAEEATLVLSGCITGPVAAAVSGTTRICSSIVDSGSRCGVAYAAEDLASAGADLHIEDSTVIGRVRVRTLDLASNTVFLARRPQNDIWEAALWCSREQAGCVRFCYLPRASITPKRFECLPPDSSQEAEFRPWFVDTRFGRPSYCLLSGDSPAAIWTGADNGSQIGVYYSLQETQAVRNVQLRAAEYVPFGLETGVFLVPSEPAISQRRGFPYGYGPYLCDWNPCGGPEDDEIQAIGIGAHLV